MRTVFLTLSLFLIAVPALGTKKSKHCLVRIVAVVEGTGNRTHSGLGPNTLNTILDTQTQMSSKERFNLARHYVADRTDLVGAQKAALFLDLMDIMRRNDGWQMTTFRSRDGSYVFISPLSSRIVLITNDDEGTVYKGEGPPSGVRESWQPNYSELELIAESNDIFDEEEEPDE